ncbi:hypothetical protein K788_0006121 (plasmid) [Paraburkholderia caribensis MBA4]|uniref:Uncharacterized protein n=1 Tax=Paraburkholderia caribensis MBA4 TaxID=1323664 RepID=A0A0P0RQX8_9BURK|nr:hypothetical protein K788_0006121 [Paraburkholderia caribensis MBA4]
MFAGIGIMASGLVQWRRAPVTKQAEAFAKAVEAPHATRGGASARRQRLAMYIVISKPKRRSV